MHRAGLVALATTLGTLGCSGAPEAASTQDRVDRTIESIIGGKASGTERDAVVVLGRFADGVRQSLCSATLVAPNLILTARHCVSIADANAMCSKDGTPVSGAMLHGDRAPGELAVFLGRGGAAPDSTTDAHADAHGARIVTDGATTICNHDVAFVVLDRTLDAPYAALRLGPPASGEAVTAVGWGITAGGALPATRQERASITIVGDGPMAFPDNATYGVGSAELLAGESACAGDSGSPLLAPSGAIVGVASRAGNGTARDPNNAASTCEGTAVHAVYTHLETLSALVDAAFAAAGAKPWLEGDPDPRTPPCADGCSPSPGGAPPPPLDPPPTASAPAPIAPESPVAPPTTTTHGGCGIAGAPLGGDNDAFSQAVGVTVLLAGAIRVLRRVLRHARRSLD